MFFRRLFLLLGIAAMLAVPTACTEESTPLGVDLQDPYTLFDGTRDTAFVSACTIFDDSMRTAGYDQCIFGDYRDPLFGSARAVTYSQISVAGSNGISLSDEVVIDSVVMTLVIDTLYPAVPDSTPVKLHIVINQLAETLLDTAYHVTLSSESLQESDVCFFDDEVTFYADSINLRMRESIYPVLKQTCSSEDFLKIVKGFSLKLAENSNRMVTVDFGASETRLTLFYHTANADSLQYVFTINRETGHSMYFQHDYSGSPIEAIANHTADSIEGSQRLYLEPLSGTRVRINMQSFLDEFREQHPWAVIHYAELLLPVNDAASDQRPLRILANKREDDGTATMVTDANVLSNPYTYAGFDGYYHKEGNYYRLRVTRHLQELLRSGRDYGTELYIDGRRSTAFHTVFNGTATDNPVRVVFIYSEKSVNTQP